MYRFFLLLLNFAYIILFALSLSLSLIFISSLSLSSLSLVSLLSYFVFFSLFFFISFSFLSFAVSLCYFVFEYDNGGGGNSSLYFLALVSEKEPFGCSRISLSSVPPYISLNFSFLFTL